MSRLRGLTILVSIIALTAALFVVHGVSAQSSGEEGQLKPGVTDSSLQNISIDCLDVKYKLSKVHENDGLARVNVGQKYETVSVKLMARLNGRVVQNRLDGAELIKKASEYETALNNFKENYRLYETSMSSLLKSDCSTQPMIFYGDLESVRDLRTKVEGDSRQLTRLISEYYDSFLTFAEQSKASEANS